jgi:cysteine synthase
MTLPALPMLEELLHPETQPDALREEALACTDELDPINLFNMHYRYPCEVINHRVIPRELTGTDAHVVMLSGSSFPTGSHKVGPAYSCLREKLLDGEITQDGSTLVFPSTGNYGIGGSWVGPRIGFRSLIVLPEEMSAERFQRIEGYGAEYIATPGSESNVKEIYDKVAELRQNPNNRILNQFEDFGNYRFHYHVTGGTLAELGAQLSDLGTPAAFVSAMGSAGTIAAGERAQVDFPGLKIVGVEPIQCPTLYNVGYGAHAIEGIGDKHVTWIHNVNKMDLLVCTDDRESLRGLQLLQEGRDVLAAELGLDVGWLDSIEGFFGISSVCNLLGAIKTARHFRFGSDQVVYTMATDGFDRYPSVMRRLDAEEGEQSPKVAAERIGIFNELDTAWALDGTPDVQRRWHNQKYFTWVEQQGKSYDELEAQRDPAFWKAEAARFEHYESKTLEMRS